MNRIENKKSTEKISEINIWVIEKINKINKSLAQLTKEKRRTQISSVIYERGDITVDPMDIKRIIKGYCEQLHAHKFDNLDKIDQFLERTHIRKKSTI